MARVLMSNPPWWGPRRGSLYMAGVRAGSRWPFLHQTGSFPGRARLREYVPYPMFLGFAATYARRTGADVTFRDSIATREGYGTFYEHVRTGRYEYVVIETATPSWEHDAEIIRELVRVAPAVKVIVTGTIGASRADEILEHHPVHAVIKGEYEKGVVRVLNGESGVIDFDFLTTDEMNKQPAPYMDALHAPLYFDSNPKGQEWPHLVAWGSRGCPFVCAFCSWPATLTGDDPEGAGKRRIRFYSHDWLMAYLPQYVKDFGIASVYFDSDTENMGDKHTLEICRAMRKVGVPWSAMCRIDTVNRETWKEMKASGCFGVKVGIESGSQEVIDKIIRKQLNLAEAHETVQFLKSIGMTVHATFSYGHPGETREQMRETKAYVERLAPTTIQESGVAHLEGTPNDRLIQLGTLPKYPGAKMDESYIKESDGAKKMAILAEQIR